MNFLTDSALRLGPFVLKTSLLYILMGIGTGSISILFLTKNDKKSGKTAFDLITNFLLIVILTWKLLPIILSPGDIISNPLMFIYASGGTIGVAVGVILGFGYLGFKLFFYWKNGGTGSSVGAGCNRPLWMVLKPVFVFFVTAAVVSASLFFASAVLLGNINESVIMNGNEIEMNSIPSTGSAAPEFELPDTDGNLISLADYRGKWVILNFWATWCPPCLAEIPTLIKFYDKADRDKIVLLGINAARTEKSAEGGDVKSYVSAFSDEKGITFPVLLDICEDEGSCVSTIYGAENLPTTIVISPEGIVTRIKTGVVDSFWLRTAVDS